MLPSEIYYSGNKYVKESETNSILFTRKIKHDWERSDWKGSVQRPNLPEVFRCGQLEDSNNGHYVKLDEAWQFFWFDIASMIYYGRHYNQLTKAEYKWLSDKWTAVGSNQRAFMNKHGLDVFRNYVTRTNMEKELPAIYTLWVGGTCTKELSFATNSKGVEMLEIPAFDGTKAPPDINDIDIRNDSRIFVANSITATKVASGGYSVNPFPQYVKNGNPQDAPIILIAKSKIYFPKNDTLEIASSVKLNPYNPPKAIFQNYPF